MTTQQQQLLIAGVVALVAAVAFYFFLWSPKNAETAEINEQIDTVEAEQVQLRARIAELEQLRATAPEIEAAIVAAQSIVPRDLALPSATRQLQLAADESGVDMRTITFQQTSQVDGAEPGTVSIDLGVTIEGGYFQIVDFLRRVEDPAITPRGIVWNNLSLAPSAYPTLNASLTGSMYAKLPAPPAEGDSADGTGQPGTEPSPGGSPSPGATATSTAGAG